jgi:N-acetyl-alpha-D-muramate 1-phosphate uridylyltransferase
MEGMIFAAGLGTRLGEFTRDRPKALVAVGGVPMLERVARSMIAAGVDRLVINTHHFGEKIEAYVAERQGFGVEVVFSREPEGPLETGGGLRRAQPLFRSGAPFLLHNADVFTDLRLADLYATHLLTSPLATLAVMHRASTRALLFDDLGLLGRVDDGKGIDTRVRAPLGPVRRLAFAGIHAISPDFFGCLRGMEGVFSIIDVYLEAAADGAVIQPFRIDDRLWIDIGKPEQLALAERALERPSP